MGDHVSATDRQRLRLGVQVCITIGLLGLVGILTIRLIRASDSERRERPSYPWTTEFESPPHREDAVQSRRFPKIPHSEQALSGHVCDAQGRPVSGARIALVGPRGAPVALLRDEGRLAESNRDGDFLLKPLVRRDSDVLSVRHPHYMARVLPAPTGPPEHVRVVLQRGLTIAGTVSVVNGGGPAAHVRVVARGTGAACAAGRPERVAPPSASAQIARTDSNGAFELQGLCAGWYQVDVSEPGLVVLPNDLRRIGRRLFLVGERAVYAQAGSLDVRFVVAPIGVVAVRVHDARTGHALPMAFPGFHPKGPFDALGNDAMSSSSVVLANGRTVSIRASDLPQATQARFFVARRFPVGGECTVKLTAPGFHPAETTVEIAPVGAGPEIPIARVDLRPKDEGDRGGARLRLVDRIGRPIRWQSLPFVFRHELRGAPPFAYLLRFNDAGLSDVISMPAGRYQVRAAAPKGRAPFEPSHIEVSSRGIAETSLRLGDRGGVEIRVTNESGDPLDDIGIRIGQGHERVRGVMRQSERRVTLSGAFVQVPGLGAAWRGSVVGLRSGPSTVEVYRHGYKATIIPIDVVAGELSAVHAVLEADPTSRWDSWLR